MKGSYHSDNMPDGVDILYNTTKKRGSSDSEVFKTYEDDPDNPFGSIVRQKHYIDKNGKEQLSALNIMGSTPGSGEEGSWDKWSRTLSSQVLSKQSPALAKKQLELAYMSREEEYREIQKLTNPTIRKYLLLPFADECDSAAEELKAAALPRQRNQVLLPVPSMKDTEVYALILEMVNEWSS